jgi:hypothetical protein
MQKVIILIIMLLTGFTSVAQIALTPKGFEQFPQDLWGKPIIINPGTWQHGFNPGCGGDGNDCGKWDRFTIQVQPYTPPPVVPPPPPPVVKQPVLIVKEATICVGDSTNIYGTWYKKPGTFVKNSPDTNLVVVITMKQQPRTDTSATIMEGDSLLFARQWRKQPGTYRDTLKCITGCDSIVTLYLHVLPDCQPCKAERLKWLALGRFSVNVFLMKEEHNDWQNRVLTGLSMNYEYRFKNGLLFDPVKRPCLGESIIGSIALRGANEVAPSSDCLTCDNLPENAPVTIEGRFGYKLSWLKGWPFVPSIAAGTAVSWNQGGNPAFKWGFVLTPEVEGIILQKAGLPTLSAFGQHNISLGTMPSDWRVGLRLHLGVKKSN